MQTMYNVCICVASPSVTLLCYVILYFYIIIIIIPLLLFNGHIRHSLMNRILHLVEAAFL